MTDKLKEIKARLGEVSDPNESYKLRKEYQKELEEVIFPFLNLFEKEDLFAALTEWMIHNTSANDGRELYGLVREAKIYLPAVFPASEFDCEEDEIDDDEWQDIISEANERLEERNAIQDFTSMVWDTISEVLEEHSPEWYLG